jgi:hypothetical protein
MSEAKEKALRIVNAYAACFSGPNGKIVLKDLQDTFGGSCFDPNPQTMAFKEGCRHTILVIEDLAKGRRGKRTKQIIDLLSKTEEGNE